MNRITTFGLVGLLSVICTTTFAARKTTTLRDWKFIRANPANAQKADFDDSTWQSVRVPHDWAIAEPFDMNIDMQIVRVLADGEKEINPHTGRTGALPWIDSGWYRAELPLSADIKNKRIFVEFDGAMSRAKVFVNGEFVGERPYGYISFSFDITKFLKPDTKNIIAVSLENPPESSRWYAGAGLYRFARIVEKSPSHIKYNGIFATTSPDTNATSAKVEVSTEVENPHGLFVEQKLFDSDGTLAATAKVPATSAAILTVKNPKLWTPETPSLYTLETSLTDKNGKILDATSTNIGIRTIKFSPRGGFELNGKRTEIKGVCMHHDLGPIGAATNVSALRRQLSILKEMGCNAIRTTHNPPSPELLDLCDKMGFLVEAEAFDDWKHPKCRNGYSVFFEKWAERDLTDFIKRDRNHPCVIIWSAGNEVNDQLYPDGVETAKTLASIIRKTDPTRPSTAGMNFCEKIFLKENAEFAKAFDIAGINYNPKTCLLAVKKYPEMIFHGSETASTVSSRGVYHFPLKKFDTFPIAKKMPFSEDYQMSSFDTEAPPWAQIPDEEFRLLDEHKNFFGEFVWTGFDYLGEPCPYMRFAPARSSYFGIVDLAGLKKDRFYLYRSRWNPSADTLHILPHWNWRGFESKPIPVMCYSNFPTVELFVNGKSQGRRTLDKNSKEVMKRYRFIWENVPYEAGELRAVAYDSSNNPRAEKIVKTADRPAQIKAQVDKYSRITKNPDELIFVEISIADKNGTFCPTSNAFVFVSVSGAGKLRALCNGDPTDQTSFASNYMRTFSGKLVAIIEPTTADGEITLTAQSLNLTPTTLTIK